MPKANVESLEVIKSFRVALWKFAEMATAALADGEGEIHRTMVWLETEQLAHWEGQIRKRHDHVERCKDAYRQKTLFKDAAGTRSSGFDERKALDKAVKALEEAEEKYKNVRRNIRELQKELHNYTGAVQRFATDVQGELPNTVAKLDEMMERLRRYLALAAPETVTSTATGSEAPGPTFGAGEPSMARGEPTVAAPAEVQAGPVVPAGTPTSEWASLRKRTPDAGARAKAEVTVGAFQLSGDRRLNGPQRVAIASLNVKHRPPAPEQTLVLAGNLPDPMAVYLERVPPLSDEDTGWFVGPTDPEVPIEWLRRVRVDQLLLVRPDLREILALPAGTLAVIRERGVASVLDEKDRELWTKAK